MKCAKLLHNPKAGAGQLSKEELISILTRSGLDCSYSSTKKTGWENIALKGEDFLIIAGGDGTIRKVAGELLDKKLSDRKLPIGLFPIGTSNNIATSLGITGDYSEFIRTLKGKNTKKYDVGRIYGLRQEKFFLESLGYGIFPSLMEEMDKQDQSSKDTPGKKIRTALELLYDVVTSCPAVFCEINLDQKDHSGKFLMVEVLNIPSIGPKLKLAPFANPGDGEFDVVLVSEEQRQNLADHISDRIQGKESLPFFKTIKAKDLKIFWQGPAMHVDDELLQLSKPKEIRIEVLEGVLDFFVPKNSE